MTLAMLIITFRRQSSRDCYMLTHT